MAESDDDKWPDRLAVNAWTGEGPSASALAAQAAAWAVKKTIAARPLFLAADDPVDERNWRNPAVGWGLVMAENGDVSEADRAVAADAPEPIRQLVAARGQAPVFRYLPRKATTLRRYFADRGPEDVAISGGARGTAPGSLPRYLLIHASPAAVPWELQYVLAAECFVGRLDLEGAALQNYVQALLTDWADAKCRTDQPVLWSVDDGEPEITWLMRHTIADALRAKLAGDSDVGAKLAFFAEDDATAAKLIDALAERQPALVVTTSHGMTGPLNDAPLMTKQLGLLVDQDHALLQPDALLGKWQPDGAIWYAHACCSAGGDSETRFAGLVEENSPVDRILKGVAALGAQVAPLPRALLGAAKPLRAFVGHVEPTFDWTLRNPITTQHLTTSLIRALYTGMFRKQPDTVGMAFDGWFRHVGALLQQHDFARQAIVRATDEPARARARAQALRAHLAARDRQNLVILGDPTACIPAIGGV